MAYQYITLFRDPTPDGYINLRYVLHMMNTAQNYADFNDAEFQEFVTHLLFVAKKMVATWHHLARYEELEDSLIEAEKSNPPLEKVDIQHISYSQDLFFELDEFLVQLKSTLDYLAKRPLAIIGKNNWPYLRTFGDKGKAILKALRNNLPQKWRNQAKIIEEMVFPEYQTWLEMVIASRDRTNHFKDGGVDAQVFLVAKTTINNEEKIVVPMWFDNLTVREYMRHAWHNLMGFVEQFTIGFLAMRFKPGFGFIHTPRPEGSVISPISVLPEEAIDPAMKVMTLLQKNKTI